MSRSRGVWGTEHELLPLSDLLIEHHIVFALLETDPVCLVTRLL